jgi:hypothetical protein
MTAHPPPPHPGQDAVARLRELLPVLYRTGVQPDRLFTHTPALVDLLAPADGPGDTRYHRARRARRLLVAAVADVGPPPCDRALRILLHLDCDPTRPPPATLTDRRAQAGALFTPPLRADTFRRPRHEGRLTRALAFALFYRIAPDPAAPRRPGRASASVHAARPPAPPAGPPRTDAPPHDPE